MALYQPSNITPSSFAGIGGGVVDVNDNVSISWQVNGNSRMYNFAIDIRENTAAGSLVHTFGDAPSDPVYGTDAQGNVRFFTFEPGTTWAAAGLTNGASYKMEITQGWYDGSTTHHVYQSSPAVFITRAAPTLSISPAAGTLTSVTQTFTGSFAQAQNDTVVWVRWVLSDGDGGVLDDTGTIYTPVLSYTYNGFFSGESYTLSCTVETSSGVTKTVSNDYTVSYDSAAATGGISTVCNADDSVTLSWSAGMNIPGIPSAEDYGSLSDGVLHLAASRSITWNEVNGESMSFAAPYAFAWRGKIGTLTDSPQTISSGTWERYEQTVTTGTTDVTRTITTSSLTKPYTGTDSHEVSVSVGSSSSQVKNVHLSNIPAYWNGSVYAGSTVYESDYPIASGPSNIQTDPGVTDVDYILEDSKHIRFLLEGTVDKLSIEFTITVTKYTGTAVYTPSQSGVSNPTVLSTTAQTASVSMNGGSITVTAEADTSGTYTVNVGYSYSYIGNDSYSGSMSYSLSSSTGTLTGVTVLSSTGTGGASAKIVQGNQYSVTIRNNEPTSCSAVVRLTYVYETDGDYAYRTIVTGTLAGAVSGAVTATTASGGATVTVERGNYTVTMYHSAAVSRTATVTFQIASIVPHESLLELNSGAVTLSNTASAFVLSVTGAQDRTVSIPDYAYAETAVVFISPTMMVVYFLSYSPSDAWYAGFASGSELPTVTDIKITGAQDCDYVFVTTDVNYNVSGNFPLNSPAWGPSTLFYASFIQNLQGGTLASSDSIAVALYRKEGTSLTPLGVFGTDVSSVRDYGVRSMGEYQYVLYYIADGAYSVGMTSDEICRQFRQFTLIEAARDADDADVYHTVSVWRFRNNIEAGAVSNGNTPGLLDNFTKYPHWQPSSQSPKSGTLTALLSYFSEGEYIRETAADMERLYALSQSVNPLFLRDMKGNLYFVRLSGPITQTTNYKTGIMEVTVSVPWIEAGDASGVKILSLGG